MPNITIDGPVIGDINAKRIMAKEITDAVEKAYKLPRSAINVIIKENQSDNIAVGGILITDRK